MPNLQAVRLYQFCHPNEPWLAQEAIKFLDRELPRDGAGLEWGSGRSTRWFGHRLAHLVSIEMDAEWYDKVRLGMLPAWRHARSANVATETTIWCKPT